MSNFFFSIFEPFIRAIARLLSFYYELPVIGGSYGFTIILLTLTVMLVLTPLTLKSTRSTIAMQHVQPELKALQKKHKDDKAALNQEMMALYKEKGINPVGGCLPMLIQLPVFGILYTTFRGLTTRNTETPFFGLVQTARASKGEQALESANFNPRYVPVDSEIYSDLSNANTMEFGPLDLAAQALEVLQSNVFKSIPYLILIIVVVVGSFYQQRQISSRRDGQPLVGNPVQQQMMKIMPLMSGIWGFFFPAALVLYQVTSNIFRIAQQGYITRSFYKGEDSIGRTANRLSQSSKDDKKNSPKDKGSTSNSSKTKNSKSQNKSKKSASGQNKTKQDAKKNKAKTSESTVNGSSTSKDRNQAWNERRTQKKKVQQSRAKARTSTSSRTTPKGTKSQARKKRKR